MAVCAEVALVGSARAQIEDGVVVRGDQRRDASGVEAAPLAGPSGDVDVAGGFGATALSDA
jgi:hypothetical protein